MSSCKEKLILLSVETTELNVYFGPSTTVDVGGEGENISLIIGMYIPACKTTTAAHKNIKQERSFKLSFFDFSCLIFASESVGVFMLFSSKVGLIGTSFK